MTLTDVDLRTLARTLALVIEPFTGQVYFAPECHQRYEALGFNPSPGAFGGGVRIPDGSAYFCSRGSVMGQVPGEVVSAAFGVFNPAIVVPAVAHGWTLTDARTICDARTEGAVAQLVRLLGDQPAGTDRAVELLTRATAPLQPEGRPVFAGIRSRPLPDQPLAAAWQLADQLREHRGDSHVNAWTSAGLDPVEIGLLTERYWGLPPRTYIRSRGWDGDQLDAAEARLRDRDLVDDAGMTDAGRALREDVERATDLQLRPAIAALGADFDDLVSIIGPWSKAIQAGQGYPGAGPHELAALASPAAAEETDT